MLLCLVSCVLTLWTGGTECRPEGALLVGLYLLYLGVHLRYLALLIRGDFSRTYSRRKKNVWITSPRLLPGASPGGKGTRGSGRR